MNKMKKQVLNQSNTKIVVKENGHRFVPLLFLSTKQFIQTSKEIKPNTGTFEQQKRNRMQAGSVAETSSA